MIVGWRYGREVEVRDDLAGRNNEHVCGGEKVAAIDQSHRVVGREPRSIDGDGAGHGVANKRRGDGGEKDAGEELGCEGVGFRNGAGGVVGQHIPRTGSGIRREDGLVGGAINREAIVV